MGHDNLAHYLQSNFSLFHHHKWQLRDVENMLPWERHINIEILNQTIKMQEQENQQISYEEKNILEQLKRRRR